MKISRYVWIGFCLAGLGCKTDDVPAPRKSVGASLTEGLVFPNAMLINDGFPPTTDSDVVLFPLGPTVIVEPDGVGIMALEVDDDEGREVAATLMQFEDDERYLRIPVAEGGGSSIISNDFAAASNLCDGLCNVVFTVQVEEAVELGDGEISASSTREILVDCRDHGSSNACEDLGEQGSGGASMLVCGDVSIGELAVSGDPVIDSHFDAALTLGAAVGALEEAKLDALAAMSVDLGLPDDSSADAVATELAAVIAQNTEAGLSLLLGELGCAVRRVRVEHSLRSCDPDTVQTLASLECSDICEPGAAELDACSSAPSSGCRGVVSDVDCAGSCRGACLVTLDTPTACGGTCIGSCDAECPDDGSGGCLGPCAGLCTGECRAPSDGTCVGRCFGVCDEPMTGTPDCSGPLNGYCTADTSAPTACPGDCFGDTDASVGSALCRQSALAVGRIVPRCEPPIVQLSFSFQAGVDMAAQDDFGNLVQSLNNQLGSLYAILARADLMAIAAADLSAAASGPLSDRIADLIDADPTNTGLSCVQDALPDLESWLDDQITQLEDLRTAAMQVVTTASPAP